MLRLAPVQARLLAAVLRELAGEALLDELAQLHDGRLEPVLDAVELAAEARPRLLVALREAVDFLGGGRELGVLFLRNHGEAVDFPREAGHGGWVGV